MDLSGKRILFIAPMFFGYERLIAAELGSARQSIYWRRSMRNA